MPTLAEMKAQKAALDLAIAEQHYVESKSALETVRGLVAEFDLSRNDVFPGQAGVSGVIQRTNGHAKVKNPVAPKYRDPANAGNTWAGRGKHPRWLQAYLRSGKALAEFAIKA